MNVPSIPRTTNAAASTGFTAETTLVKQLQTARVSAQTYKAGSANLPAALGGSAKP